MDNSLLFSSEAANKEFQIARFGTQIQSLSENHRLFRSSNFYSSELVVIATRFDVADIRNLDWLITKLKNHGKTVAITD